MAKVKSLFRFRGKTKSITDLCEWSKNDEKLLKAVEKGDAHKVQKLLHRKTLNPTKAGPKGLSVFHLSAAKGQLQVLETFIDYGAELNATDLQGHTPLHLAAKNGWPQVLDKLLQRGASHDSSDTDQMTALHHASGSVQLPCVEILLRYGAKINMKDKDGRTPLFYCIQTGDAAMCKFMLEKGADVNVVDIKARTPLMIAALQGNVELCELLLTKGAIQTMADYEGHSAMFYAENSSSIDLKRVFDGFLSRPAFAYQEREITDKRPAVTVEVNHPSPSVTDPSDNEEGSVAEFILNESSDSSAPVSPNLTKQHKQKAVSAENLLMTSSPTNRLHSQSFPKEGKTFDDYQAIQEDRARLTENVKQLGITNLKLRDKMESTQLQLDKLQKVHADSKSHDVKALENEIIRLTHELQEEQSKTGKLQVQMCSLMAKTDEKNNKVLNSSGDSGRDRNSWADSEDSMDSMHIKSSKEADSLTSMFRNQLHSLRLKNESLKEEVERLEKHQLSGLPVSNKDNKADTKDEGTSIDSDLQQDADKLNLETAKQFNDLQLENIMLHEEVDRMRGIIRTLPMEGISKSNSIKSSTSSGRRKVAITEDFSSSDDECGADSDKERSLDVKEENKHLKSQCDQLKDGLSRLQNSYTALIEAGDKLQEEYDEGVLDKQQLEAYLEKVIEQNRGLEKENESIVADSASLHKDLENLVEEYERLQDEYRRLQREKEEVESKQVNIVVNKDGISTKEAAQLTEENQKLKVKCAEMEETVTRVKHDHDIVLEEVQSLQEQTNEIQAERDQLQQEVESVQDDMETITQQFDGIQQEYMHLEQDYAELLADKEKLEQEFMDSERQRVHGNTIMLNGVTTESSDDAIDDGNVNHASHSYQALLQENNRLYIEKREFDSKMQDLSDENDQLHEELMRLINSDKKQNGFVVADVKALSKSSQRSVSDSSSDDNDDGNNGSCEVSDEAIVPKAAPRISKSGEDKDDRQKLNKQMEEMEKKMQDMEQQHQDTVNSYRTHLISAVQGHMDPEVKQTLRHIVEIRSMEEFC